MENSTLSEFCGSTFWDANLTWDTDSPEFTPCFEKTVLVWIPCVFLWTFSSFDLYGTFTSKVSGIPWNWRNIFKLVFIGLLIVTCVFDIFYYWLSGNSFPVDVYSPLIKLVTLVLCGCLVVAHKIHGQRSSGVMFLFWFLTFLCGLPRFLMELKAHRAESQNPIQISYVAWFFLSCAMFIFNLFSDVPPKHSEYLRVEKPSPEEAASFPSRMTFFWLDQFIYLGYKKPLENGDLWSIKYTDMTSQIFPRFHKHWSSTLQKNTKSQTNKTAEFMNKSNCVDFKAHRSKGKPSSILPALIKAFGPSFLFGSLMLLIEDILAFISPELLKYLIAFMENDEPLWRGFLYASLMLVVACIQTLFLAQYFLVTNLVGLRIRTALMSAVYRKALRLSNAARKESTVGEIVNLMSVDAQRFMSLMPFLNMLWSAPLQIAIAMIFLWRTLGPSVLAGLGVMVVMIPLNGYIANKAQIFETKKMKNMDQRVKMMNDILSGIKVLKLYAWEPCFEQRVTKIREKEVKLLRKSAFLNAITSFLWICSPVLVSVTTFAVYVLIDENNVLDASKAFVSLSLFNIMGMPLTMLPMVIVSSTEAAASLKRLNKFMNSEEIDSNSISHEEKEDDPLVMEDGTFSWGVDEEPVLNNINLRIKKGSLVAVVGTVGSGKSSLISAFLGEMDKRAGYVNIKGSAAYVPQLAWIQNATLQDNILFGKALDRKAYHKVIDACALRQDLEMLTGGDQTEIGEKGINLSGGQKQRISLARAVYADRDVYYLDDPLSAVDSHVGKHIFENVISSKGVLAKKTRLFVTHGITFLPETDVIVVLKEGTVSEIGSYRELLEKKGAFSEFLTTYLEEVECEGTDLENEIKDQKSELQNKIARQISTSSETGSVSSLKSRKRIPSYSSQHDEDILKGEKLIEEEKAEIGGVKWEVYKHYLCNIGFSLFSVAIVFNFVHQGFSVGTNLWLSHWANDADNIVINGTQNIEKRNMYLGVYALLGLGQSVCSVITDVLPRLGCLMAAVNLHKALLFGILRVPLSFTDTTPTGRIVSRFSKDVDTLDLTLPWQISDALFCLFDVAGTLFVITYATPIFILVIIPIAIVYYFIQRYFIATSRQLKRLESISRSPIYSHFSESVSGSSIIRAYNVQDRFIQESEQKVDLNQACTYPGLIANRWLAVRLEIIGNLVIFFSALFGVFGKGTLNAGIVGLSVTYALQITHTLNWMVRMLSNIETDIVSVERIKEYSETPQEAPWEITPSQIGKDWPEEGKVEFVDFKVRYREGLDLVIKGISFAINGGEKVGIVGRTGAGKSSLTLSLFRIVEAAGGKIIIDGIDVSKLGLHDLRSRLTIIPQDPVLFPGSLRLNLDPYGKYSDDQIWRALELSHLKSFVKGFPAGLQHEVTEGGENFSVGQRQLICLARALLRKTKVLVLDEATAAVDLETDDLIQRTIRSEFRFCTVLTIAHRLNTIMDSDRVLVLDHGMVIELDSPTALLKNRSSVFYGMAHEAGLI